MFALIDVVVVVAFRCDRINSPLFDMVNCTMIDSNLLPSLVRDTIVQIRIECIRSKFDSLNLNTQNFMEMKSVSIQMHRTKRHSKIRCQMLTRQLHHLVLSVSELSKLL